MVLNDKRITELAEKLSKAMDGGSPGKGRAAKALAARRDDFENDPVSRTCRLDRIRWLQRTYKLHFLVRQHTFGLPGAEHLGDEALIDLHRDMERARDCIAEGIPLEDAGLIKSQYP